MKPIALFISSLILVSQVSAQTLSHADREALLEKLEALSAGADARVDDRFRSAINAYRSAAANDQAALELHLKCIEKVNFKDQHRKEADFREWKRKEDEKLSTSNLGYALRLQINWLSLTLRAASAKTKRDSLLPEVQQLVDAIVRDADKLKAHQQLLNQSVTSSFFARAYDINTVKVDNWPLAPGDLEKIYDQILLPPHRNPERVAALRAGWIKRIQQEIALKEVWEGNEESGKKNGEDGEKKKIGTADALRSPEFELFMAEELPELQWKMEVDLFKNGDEKTSSLNMLAHLEKFITHKSAPAWAGELDKLLNPKKPGEGTPAP